MTKNDSAIFIPKMTHITLSSDNKVNLLKPFCRWVWRFLFMSLKCMDRTFSSDSLIYQRSGNMSDVFIQADKAQEDHSDKAKQVET